MINQLDITDKLFLDITKLFEYCICLQEDRSFKLNLNDLSADKIREILNDNREDLIIDYICKCIGSMAKNYPLDYIEYVLEFEMLWLIHNHPCINNENMKTILLAKNLLAKGFYAENLDYFFTFVNFEATKCTKEDIYFRLSKFLDEK